MLILRSSPASPFGRKVKIAAAVLGLSERIEVVVADTNDPNEPLRRQNPLGKIPALILENNEVIYDSAVIVEYLDWLAGGGKIIPAPGPDRLGVLTRQALADGLAEAALLQVYEGRMREPEHHSAKWLDLQAGKVTRGLAAAQAGLDRFTPRDIGGIALACALGYLDLRFAGGWRAAHTGLVEWLNNFERATPSFDLTRAKA
jgi:glutathione S-transferase